MTFVESRYEDRTRTRNRLVIAGCGAAGLVAVVATWATTTWPLRNAMAMTAILAFFIACLWWMFGSKKAGPVTLSPRAKYWIDRTFKTATGGGDSSK